MNRLKASEFTETQEQTPNLWTPDLLSAFQTRICCGGIGYKKLQDNYSVVSKIINFSQRLGMTGEAE